METGSQDNENAGDEQDAEVLKLCQCVCGGYLYTVGGYNERFRLISSERYDFSIDQWSPLPTSNLQWEDFSNGRV